MKKPASHTVICTDGKYLAADSLTTFGNVRWEYKTKIYKLPNGDHYAYSGNIPDGEAVYTWLKGETEAKPESIDESFSCMYTKKGKLYHMWANLVPYKGPKISAIGCGGDFAIAAMRSGLDAIEACKLAAKYVEGCGGKVDWVEIG